jgi:hypothetical protein
VCDVEQVGGLSRVFQGVGVPLGLGAFPQIHGAAAEFRRDDVILHPEEELGIEILRAGPNFVDFSTIRS